MTKKKEKHSRLFIYKVYKIICKMLHTNAICYGKVSKKSTEDVIYAQTDVLKLPLMHGEKIPFMPQQSAQQCLKIRKNAKKYDIQKVVVEKILKTLEKDDIWIADFYEYTFDSCSTIKKGTCFEEKLIEMDLNHEVK